jgi:hypothetical protein
MERTRRGPPTPAPQPPPTRPPPDEIPAGYPSTSTAPQNAVIIGQAPTLSLPDSPGPPDSIGPLTWHALSHARDAHSLAFIDNGTSPVDPATSANIPPPPSSQSHRPLTRSAAALLDAFEATAAIEAIEAAETEAIREAAELTADLELQETP